MDSRGGDRLVKHEYVARMIDAVDEAIAARGMHRPLVSRPIRILFAPDWRAGGPYQTLLADALVRRGADVRFLRDYKRVLPLSRLLSDQECDILHLHWPEAYYPHKGDGFDLFRTARFPHDLSWATHKTILVTTAHNLRVHNRAHGLLVERNVRFANRRSKLVFAHSDGAKRQLVQAFGLNPTSVRIIPHGDLSAALRHPVSQTAARTQLGLAGGKLAIMFGTVEPYKGLEDVVAWWHKARPPIHLAILGRPSNKRYAAQISRAIGDSAQILSRLEFLSDSALSLWLSAADVVIFNYREVFTSGAASLARSYGVPLLLPRRLDTVELDEPTPYVRRFTDIASDFRVELDAALSVRPDFAAAASWRQQCSWDRVADLTLEGYRRALGDRECAE
jgi:glycosyltransferase involved in cell wall biosynthesis